VAVNYAPNQSQCYLRLPFSSLAGHAWKLEDLTGEVAYDREGDELESRGLYLDLRPWQYHVFELKGAREASRVATRVRGAAVGRARHE
jgi:hypothetical protein